MPHFSLPFEDVATGAVADVFKTLAALIVADTQGHRCRVRGLHVGPSDDTALDFNIAVRLSRILDVSAGSAGTSTPVTTALMPKHDPGSVDSLVSGGLNFTGEPSTYEARDLYVNGFNMRGGLINERFDEDEKYVATRDMIIALRFAPRTGTVMRVSGVILFEVF